MGNFTNSPYFRLLMWVAGLITLAPIVVYFYLLFFRGYIDFFK